MMFGCIGFTRRTAHRRPARTATPRQEQNLRSTNVIVGHDCDYRDDRAL
jgi:hypothetical protein